MRRYSKKREAILQCLQSTKDHPSAEWIYQQLKADYPSLSLATVYRNLGQLILEGRAASMGVVQGQERFDARTVPHVHAVCVRCGKVMDAEGIAIPDEMRKQVADATGFDTAGAFLHLYGLCPECRKNETSSPSGIQE